MNTYADNSHRSPRAFYEHELRQLLRMTTLHASGWRDHVVICIALGTGLCAQEILALNIGDVFDSSGRARHSLSLALSPVLGAQRLPALALSDELRAKLERLLRVRRASAERFDPNAPVFVSRFGLRLSVRQLHHAFEVWQHRAGLARRLGFDALYHPASLGLRGSEDCVRRAASTSPAPMDCSRSSPPFAD